MTLYQSQERECIMALLDLQAMDTPADEAFDEVATGSSLSVVLCTP